MIALTYPAGDFTGATLSGPEYTCQKIRQVLSFILGEWFLDQNLGVPWFEILGVKDPSPAFIVGVLRQKILAVPGIVSVPELILTDPDNLRNSTVTFRAIYKDGQPIDGTIGTPVGGI